VLFFWLVRRPLRLALLLGLLLLPAAPAAAATSQETTFQDDPLLVYGTPEQQFRTVEQLAALGVDRLRISVFWRLVAPNADGRTRPQGFDATDHRAYGDAAWARYDRIVRAAARFGVAVNFNLTSPGPEWATGDPGDRPDLKRVWRPDPREFGQFALAAGRRYSGEVPGIPRVSYWSVWNEPNQGAWLAPQYVPAGGRYVEVAPRLYRELAGAAVGALGIAGHSVATDTILIGETAPKGAAPNPRRNVSAPMAPRRFLLRLYCLDDNAQYLRGAAAEEQGCPTSGDQGAQMRAQHPGLFAISGWAHHPYSLIEPPTRRPADRESYTLANVRDLGRLLQRVFARSGVPIPGREQRFPLFLTEFGYQTNPPDPLGVSTAVQARYLNESEYLAARNPQVKTLAQFLLVDDDAEAAAFQTGLLFKDGRRKPAYAAYRLPFWVPRQTVRRGQAVSVWGLARGGVNGTRQTVRVEVRPRGAKRWRTLRTLRTEPRRGYLQARVRVARTSALRLSWRDPRTGRTHRSRAVPVTVRR
jgi:hypothetical protein